MGDVARNGFEYSVNYFICKENFLICEIIFSHEQKYEGGAHGVLHGSQTLFNPSRAAALCAAAPLNLLNLKFE